MTHTKEIKIKIEIYSIINTIIDVNAEHWDEASDNEKNEYVITQIKELLPEYTDKIIKESKIKY